MKLTDAIKHQGNPFEIPDCSRDDLPQFFVDMGFKVGVEIGVDKGEFSVKFCQVGLKLYSIDSWGNENHYEQARKTLAPYPNSIMIKEASMKAVDEFSDSSLDFVYIDGNHDFRYIAEDLVEWTKRVRPGGMVSGHDYFYAKSNKSGQHWHVAQVLNAFINAYKIPNWYLLGRKHPQPGEKRDKWRSWMFIKP